MNGYRQMYERYSPLVASLAELSFPVPEVLHKTMEFVFNANLRLAFETENFDIDDARRLFEEAKSYKLQLDAPGLTYQLTHRLDDLGNKVEADHRNVDLIRRLGEVVAFARELPLVVNFNHPQNIVYAIKQCYWESMKTSALEGDNHAAMWITEFRRAADKLKVAVAEE